MIKSDPYKKAQELWNTWKEDDEKLNTKIMHLKSQASEIKSRHIKSFFSPQTESRENPPNLEEEETIETVASPHDDEKFDNFYSSFCYITEPVFVQQLFWKIV